MFAESLSNVPAKYAAHAANVQIKRKVAVHAIV